MEYHQPNHGLRLNPNPNLIPSPSFPPTKRGQGVLHGRKQRRTVLESSCARSSSPNFKFSPSLEPHIRVFSFFKSSGGEIWERHSHERDLNKGELGGDLRIGEEMIWDRTSRLIGGFFSLSLISPKFLWLNS